MILLKRYRLQLAHKALKPVLACLLMGMSVSPMMAGIDVWTGSGPEGGLVRGVVIDPLDRLTVYAATSIGVFKSVDLGDHWTRLNNTPATKVVIDPKDHNVLYAPGGSGFTFKSSNAGQSWERLGIPSQATDLVIHPQDSQILFAATISGVYKSSNGGGLWAITNGGSVLSNSRSLVIDPADPSILYVGIACNCSPPSRGSLFKSSDGGATWRQLAQGLFLGGQTVSINSLAIDPRDHQTVYATSYWGFYKSTDGGASWTSRGVSGGPVYPAVTLAVDPSNSLIYVGTEGAGVFRSADGGGSWTAASNGLINKNIVCLTVDSVDGTVYSGTWSGFFKSTNQANSWTEKNQGLVHTTIVSVTFDPRDPATLLATTPNNGIFRSTDSGEVWAKKSSNLAGDTITQMVSHPWDPSILYSVVANRGVYKSIDGGETWFLANSGSFASSPTSLLLDPANPQTLYAVQGGGVYKSTNSGGSWSQLVQGLATMSIAAIYMHPEDSQILYLTGTGLAKSVNGGLSWSRLNLGETTATGAFAFEPANPEHLWVVGSSGLLQSEDGGQNWNSVASDLPQGSVLSALAVDAGNPDILYTSIYNLGVYRSLNRGLNWTALNNGLVDQSGITLVADPVEMNRLYLRTAGAGLLSFTLSERSTPSITVLSPRQGQTWVAQPTQVIRWASSRITGSVKIEYSADGGASFSTIAENAPDTGRYLWMFPSVISSACRIRISQASSGVSVTSGTFTIAPIDPPIVTFVSPVAGVTVSDVVTLRATAIDIRQIERVVFYVDGLPVGESTTAPYSATWDSSRATNGPHHIVARAMSVSGKVAEASVVVRTSNLIPSSAVWLLPSAARVGGVGNTDWKTDLTVVNPTQREATFILKFLGNNNDGVAGVEKIFTLEAGGSSTFADVLGTVFGVTSGYGAIQLMASTDKLSVLSQTATPGAGGTFGQSVPAINSSEWIGYREQRSLLAIREDAAFRTNLILVNGKATSLAAKVSLISSGGQNLGSKIYSVPSLGMIQISRIVRDLGVTEDVSDARLVLSTEDFQGGFTGYAAIIDNATGDPRTILAQNPGPGFVPASARALGAGGTFWRTDLTVANIDSAVANLRLKFFEHDQNGRNGPERSFALDPGESVTFPDVLGSVFGLESGFGAIRVEGSLRLNVLSQTWTPSAGGTFGQSVPGILGDGNERSPITIAAVCENEQYRTNLILANNADTVTAVDVQLMNSLGEVLGWRQYNLSPFSMTQVTRVVRELGIGEDICGMRLLLSTRSITGRFTAYSALIDNRTGDPRTLLPSF